MKKPLWTAIAIFLVLAILVSSGLALRAGFHRGKFFAGKPLVILITMDTTRFDHLGCYGYDKKTSPNIDRLASSGVRFTNCFVSMPNTDPSHVSILTSTYPRTHGVLKNGMEVTNPDIVSIAEWFKGRGYETAAITAKQYLNPDNLKLKGFDYVSAPRSGMKTADVISSEAIEFMEKNSRRNVFLWVHFFDPHVPYTPPLPYALLFLDEFNGYMEKPVSFLPDSETWTAEEIAYHEALYDGEIRYMDQHIGKILKYLEDRFSESSPGPFIIIVADHGESLGELQNDFKFVFAHGKFLYNSTVKVPLIMSWKGRLPEGGTVDSLVETIDIAPTIIDLMEEEKLPEFSGVSFRKSIFDNTEHKPYAFIQRRYFEKPPKPYLKDEGVAIVSREYKLIENSARGIEIYNLEIDEEERDNLAPTEPDLSKELQAQIAGWREKYPRVKANYVISKEKQESLRALGYLP